MTTTTRFCAGIAVLALASGLTACGGSHGASMLPSSGAPQSPFATAAQPAFARSAPAGAESLFVQPDAAAKIKVAPTSLAFLATGSAAAQSVTVTESKYTGKFTAKSTCTGIAALSPSSGKGPTFKTKITPSKAGSCAITFSDTNKGTAKLSITVTTTALKLGASSISPNSKSVKIVLNTVGGKKPTGITTTAVVNLSGCSGGCSVNAPSSPGSDNWSLTIYDASNGAGKVLATGTTTATVVVAKANSLTAAQLSKVPAFLVFGAIPTGAAGTASSHLLTLAVQDADHATISGNYSTAVKVTDSDTSSISQGSAFSLNGAASSRSVSLTKSSDSLTLKYGGLAMASVTLTASASGATGATGHFAPTLAGIVYSGPENGSTPEIDLYNTAVGAPGNSGAFSLTQKGWRQSPTFANNFTFALGGTANNCSSYAVTPASGTAATYTVKVGATPVAGSCTISLTGAPGTAKQSVLLTYTTSTVGINAKHRKP